VNTIRTQSGGTLGTSKDERGIVLPEFAVPNARTGPLDKDANIAQDDCSTSENPCPSDAGRSPACEIPRQGAIRVCDYFDRPLVLSLVHQGATASRPRTRRPAASRYRGRVNFLSIDVRDDPGTVRQIVSEHGWKMPVGFDRDGAVSDLYRVAYAPPSSSRTRVGSSIPKDRDRRAVRPMLNADVKRLLRQSRARARQDADGRGGRARGGLGHARAARGAPGCPALPVDRRRLRSHSTSSEGASRHSRTDSRVPGDQPPPPADPLGLPRLHTSDSTSTSSRPRSRRSPWSA
jgi:hypothetical protein